MAGSFGRFVSGSGEPDKNEGQPVPCWRMKRLALLNPYAAGSHALWEDGLVQHLPDAAALAGDVLEVRSWSLPGRHWKWRMHQAGMTLAERMVAEVGEGWIPDAFLVTDMMDLGQFRAALPARLRSIPVVLYFHENQLTFPDHPERPPKEWDRHYAFMNLSSALLADAVWFNSDYHRRVFLEAVPGFVKGLPSPRPVHPVGRILTKSEVVPIGIRQDAFDAALDENDAFGGGDPVVVWNHRWEYDKGPEAFHEVLLQARAQGCRFRLAMMGQSFGAVPDAFGKIESAFSGDIVQWGPVQSRAEYIRKLASCDVALVTAHHDFFGISVLESAAVGLDVVAPNALAYPEHFGAHRLPSRLGLLEAFVRSLSLRPQGNWTMEVKRYAWPKVAQQAWEGLNRVWEEQEATDPDAVHRS